ncbi:DNA primase [bacterium]|nr:DNA primase [bacterium]
MERTYADALDEIRNRVDIVDIVQTRVLLKRKGQNWWGCCPFHKEKTPSFSVSPSKGIFKCFGCGESGDAITFLMKINNQSFSEVIQDLAKQYGIELPKTYGQKKDNSEEKQKAREALKDACEYYQENLYSCPEAKKALEYLYSRGITDEIIKEYKIGYSMKQYSALQENFKDKYTFELLEKAGLVLTTEKGNKVDRFRHRIMIPIIDDKNNIVAFGARAIDEGQNPKYLNSPDTILYNKSRILYGINVAKDAIIKEDYTIIMEGYFDVISAQANGLKNCVAACGTALTVDHIKLISRYSQSRKLYLAFDTDSAGVMATDRSSAVIKEAFQGLGDIKSFDASFSSMNEDKYACEIRVIVPPQGKDPDEYIREKGVESYKKYLQNAQLLLDFQIDRALKEVPKTASVSEKISAVRKILPLIEEIKNNIVQNEYIKSVATKLGIDETALVREFNNLSRASVQERQQISPIVTKTSNISEKAQKNLLSLYLTTERTLDYHVLSEKLKQVKFTEKNLIILKNTIDKLVCQVNNDNEKLTDALYVHFAEDSELKEIITDLIYLSDCFNNLAPNDLEAVIDENISRINAYNETCFEKELKTKYSQANSEEESIQYQKQLIEQLQKKLKTGD